MFDHYSEPQLNLEQLSQIKAIVSSFLVRMVMMDKNVLNCELNEAGALHCLAGPALTYKNGRSVWYIHGINITERVEDWIEECDVNSNWKEWTDAEKILFRLKFP